MKISYNWLRQYIDLEESAEEVAQMLTSTGLEVEGISRYESVRGGLKGLVIGEVVACAQHPNADRLSLTTVDIGGEAPCQIICGDPHVAVGQKVVVAPPGVTLYPLDGEAFTLKKAKIRGEYSYGMLCAEKEIGVGEAQQRIIVLGKDAPANGASAAEHYQVESDAIFEIGLTPNRGDAASHIGVARDLRALKGRPIRWPSIEAFEANIGEKTGGIAVRIDDADACRRYSAVAVADVAVAESPPWLRHRLQAIGLTPINNVVDATNYVLHETGQPLHAFDADRIAGDRVTVKNMPSGSVFETLDKKERSLHGDDLMICNEKEGMCIAGVMGSLRHGIGPQTRRVFLESAYFSPRHIRQTSMRHQLKTDAAFRFERGVDPEGTLYALKRATLLIAQLAGGQIASEMIDLYPNRIAPRNITVKDRHVNRLIGKDIARKEAVDILAGLDISVVETNPESYTVSAPPYRTGIECEADIIEEILRIYGFDRIEVSPHTSAPYLSPLPEKDPNRYKRVLGEMLAAHGYYEIATNSITSAAYHRKYETHPEGEPVEIVNASSEEQSAMRRTLLFTGLEVCAHNLNRQQKNLKLFEWGRIYRKRGTRYEEEERLALFLSGDRHSENWRHTPVATTYFDLAQQALCLLEKASLAHRVTQADIAESPLLEYGTVWEAHNERIGQVGKVKPQLADDFGVEQEVFYADFSVKALFKAMNAVPTAAEISKYPEVRRDLSLIIDKRITFREIMDLIVKTEKKYLKEVVAFDVYEGSSIPSEKKAYGLGFVLRDTNKTLKDKEIDATMKRIMNALEQKMGVTIRKSS